MPAIGKNVKRTVKDLGKSAVKRVLNESLETLREGGKQLSHYEDLPPESGRMGKAAGGKVGGKLPENYERIVKNRDRQRLEELDRRIREIRMQGLVEDLQKRISEGEEISLVDYPELGWEQRQVLQAQMQAVKERKLRIAQLKDGGLSEPGTKRKRGLFRGRRMKSRIEKLKRKSEIRMSPSG